MLRRVFSDKLDIIIIIFLMLEQRPDDNSCRGIL